MLNSRLTHARNNIARVTEGGAVSWPPSWLPLINLAAAVLIAQLGSVWMDNLPSYGFTHALRTIKSVEIVKQSPAFAAAGERMVWRLP